MIKVLIVDDDVLLRQSLQTLLPEIGPFQVIGDAGDGVLGAELAMRHGPDVVLMDMRMPAMSGIEATRRIKQDQPDVAIIGMTMHDEEEAMRLMRSAGAQTIISKAKPVADILADLRVSLLAAQRVGQD
jgi:DNA-binding NarL/FixJ family response regulator